MQAAVLRFSLHCISSKTLVGRKWKNVNPMLQDMLFISDAARVVEEILMTELILGESGVVEPQFINSRAFVSVFQVACFPLKEYDEPTSGLIVAAQTLLAQFESIVHHVRRFTFDPLMTWDFRSRFLLFVHCYKRSINADTPFLMQALDYRDRSDRDTEKFARNERSIDLYLGGLGHDTFIFGI